MMTCREISEFLLEYTSGELDPAVRAEFEEHIRLCENCQEYLRQYRATISATQAAAGRPAEDTTEIPDELVTAILNALKEAR